MTVALYMDEHIPFAITKGLRQRGVDVLTVQEDERRGLADPIILDRATELKRVMFSQDEDLPQEAYRRQSEGINFSGVIYARQSSISIGDCIKNLELIAKASSFEDHFNNVLYLPL